MDQRLAALETMLELTAVVIDEAAAHLDRPTPCPELDVAGLLDHLAVWVQVFDAAVNDRTVEFDPMSHHVTASWATIFGDAAGSILDGLRRLGSDRMMRMTGNPLPGEFVLNMLLTEYVGHGWDLCRALDRPAPYTDELTTISLAAAQAIIEPRYRGTGLFGAEVASTSTMSSMDQFVAFIGRDPQWTASPRPLDRSDR